MALVLCTLPDNALYLTFVRISQRVPESHTQTVWLMLGWLKFTKGNNSVKNVDGVMVLNL